MRGFGEQGAFFSADPFVVKVEQTDAEREAAEAKKLEDLSMEAYEVQRRHLGQGVLDLEDVAA